MKAGALLLVVAVVAAGIAWTNHVPLPAGISIEDYRQASRRFRDRYRREPQRLDVLSLLGEQAAASGDLETARICFREIPSDHPEYGASARVQEGQVLIHLDRAEAAEESLRAYLELVRGKRDEPPRLVKVAYQWLVYLLSVQLRFEERRVLLEEMHAHDLAGVWESKLMFFPQLLIWNSPEGKQRLAEFLERDPRNAGLLLAHGRYLTTDGRLAEAETLLEDLQRRAPDDLHVLAARLECCFESDDWEGFFGIARLLPPFDPGEPWLLTRMRGQWALHEERWDDAAAEFQRVLRTDPADPWAQMGLARAWGAMNEADLQTEALARSVVISEIRVDLYNVQENRPQACRSLADACARIGYERAADWFRRHAVRIETDRESLPPEDRTGSPPRDAAPAGQDLLD